MEEVGGRLDQTLEQLNAKLQDRHLGPASHDEFDAAMREWTTRTLYPLMSDETMTFEAACQTLLHDDNENLDGSPQGRLLKTRFARFVAARAMHRLFRLVPEG